jgi:energy-coupling factor transporter ATP-binding protein EcfA2
LHISKLTLVNYRNFKNATLMFSKGVNTIIGENGAGKTNVFRAIRLLLDDNMVRLAYKIDESDFHRGIGAWQGHWIIISVEFEEISQDEAIQALFLHGTGVWQAGVIGKATYNLIFRPNKQVRLSLAQLADFDLAGMNAILQRLTIDDYETIFTGRSEANFADPAVYSSEFGLQSLILFLMVFGLRRIATVAIAFDPSIQTVAAYAQPSRDVGNCIPSLGHLFDRLKLEFFCVSLLLVHKRLQIPSV